VPTGAAPTGISAVLAGVGAITSVLGAVKDPNFASIANATINFVNVANLATQWLSSSGSGFLTGALGTFFSAFAPIVGVISSIVSFANPKEITDTMVADSLLESLTPALNAAGITSLTQTREREPYTEQMEPFRDVFDVAIASLVAGSAGETERKGSALAGILRDNLSRNNATTEQIQASLVSLLGPDVQKASMGLLAKVTEEGFMAANQDFPGLEGYTDLEPDKLQKLEARFLQGLDGLEFLYGNSLTPQVKADMIQTAKEGILEEGIRNRTSSLLGEIEADDDFSTKVGFGEDAPNQTQFVIASLTGLDFEQVPENKGLINQLMTENPDLREAMLDAATPERLKQISAEIRDINEVDE